MSEQPEVHAGRLLPGALLALVFHIIVNYCVVNHAFRNICEGQLPIILFIDSRNSEVVVARSTTKSCSSY